MDPEATIRDLREALRDGAHMEALEHMQSLLIWLLRGGLLPKLSAKEILELDHRTSGAVADVAYELSVER